MHTDYDLSEIEQIAQLIVSSSKNNVLLFYGDMGVGKTTLIKSLVKELGVTETVSSPTFSIVNEYLTKGDKLIYHFDFYRIKEQEEALDLGFEEYMATGDWIFIEWPEKIADFIPLEAQKITIEEIKDKKRRITIH